MSGTIRRRLRAGSFGVVIAASCLSALAGCGGGAAPASPAEAPPTEAPAPPAPAPEVAEKAAAPAPASSEGWPFGPEPSGEERTALLARLARDPGPIKSNWVPPGRSGRYGHAEGLVSAPPAAVRARLVDFAHYKDLAGPKFKSVRVVDKHDQDTDVYFQLPIMKGLVTIWYVTRFPPARPAGGGDVVEGTFVKGNIKGMHIAFKVLAGPDERSSVMLCDLLLSPSVPAPQGAVDEELRDACGDAINAVRNTTGANP